MAFLHRPSETFICPRCREGVALTNNNECPIFGTEIKQEKVDAYLYKYKGHNKTSYLATIIVIPIIILLLFFILDSIV
jgi:hypothetical protein